MLIVFVDTVFEADLTIINRTNADGIIWAKEVEDYQRFGVVVTDESGYMTQIVEKPSTPISSWPTSGCTTSAIPRRYGRGSTTCSKSPTNKGEFYLTDAFQHMIEQRPKRILTAEVGGWYDCGKLDTLLETNEILLRKGRGAASGVPRRHAARSGSYRGRSQDRAKRDRAQRYPGTRRRRP